MAGLQLPPVLALGGVSGCSSPRLWGSQIYRQPLFLLGICSDRVCSITLVFGRQRVPVLTRAAALHPEPLPLSGTGHKFYPQPCLQTCGQADTPLPEMSLKRFRELIPSLLNAWKLLTLNLYRHN